MQARVCSTAVGFDRGHSPQASFTCDMGVIYGSLLSKRELVMLDTGGLIPRSHQSLNMLKSCVVKYGLKLFSL